MNHSNCCFLILFLIVFKAFLAFFGFLKGEREWGAEADTLVEDTNGFVFIPVVRKEQTLTPFLFFRCADHVVSN